MKTPVSNYERDKKPHRTVGNCYEQMAAEYLEKNGYRILERNYHAGKFGEIDIIARKDGVLVFVEVKYRRNSKGGDPKEAVTRQKQIRICRAANRYFSEHSFGVYTQCRFDVIAVLGDRLEHVENAFEYLSGHL